MDTKTDQLAELVAKQIGDGMVLGLGTGRTAERAIRGVARRVKEESLKDVRCVATSVRSEELARGLGLELLDMSEVSRIDFLFDGADEVDRGMRMIKGGGGAMTREKIVAQASAFCLYMVQDHKVVERLGTRAALPVEVMRFGLASITDILGSLELEPRLRLREDGREFVTDNGNLIIDIAMPADIDPLDFSVMLKSIAGVVEHGLFVSLVTSLAVENESGEVEVWRLEEGEGDEGFDEEEATEADILEFMAHAMARLSGLQEKERKPAKKGSKASKKKSKKTSKKGKKK